MGTDAHALLLGVADDPMHDVAIPRMKSTGDVRRANDLQHRPVVADVLGTEALTHVRLQIDLCRHFPGFLGQGDPMSHRRGCVLDII